MSSHIRRPEPKHIPSGFVPEIPPPQESPVSVALAWGKLARDFLASGLPSARITGLECDSGYAGGDYITYGRALVIAATEGKVRVISRHSIPYLTRVDAIDQSAPGELA